MNATEETAFRLRLFPAITKGQFAQEMLCQAVLSALPGYTAVTVNQPLGGRDKGVDVTGRLNGREFIASVSFTAVDDQTKKVRQSRIKKFAKDMEKAEKHAFAGLAFVIFTNISFTDLEKDVLRAEGARRQLSEIVILDCANIAAFLCSPKGLPIRYQFLGIELSETEKNGFFVKVQESMENYVDTRLKNIEAYLDDMMFASEIERSLQRIEIKTAFSSKYSLFFKDRFYIEYRFKFSGVPGVKWLRIIICRSKKTGKWARATAFIDVNGAEIELQCEHSIKDDYAIVSLDAEPIKALGINITTGEIYNSDVKFIIGQQNKFSCLSESTIVINNRVMPFYVGGEGSFITILDEDESNFEPEFGELRMLNAGKLLNLGKYGTYAPTRRRLPEWVSKRNMWPYHMNDELITSDTHTMNTCDIRTPEIYLDLATLLEIERIKMIHGMLPFCRAELTSRGEVIIDGRFIDTLKDEVE